MYLSLAVAVSGSALQGCNAAQLLLDGCLQSRCIHGLQTARLVPGKRLHELILICFCALLGCLQM